MHGASISALTAQLKEMKKQLEYGLDEVRMRLEETQNRILGLGDEQRANWKGSRRLRQSAGLPPHMGFYIRRMDPDLPYKAAVKDLTGVEIVEIIDARTTMMV